MTIILFPPRMAVKALDDTGRIGGYLAVWGSANTRDLHGEYFTPETDFGLDWYPARPVLYHHAQDAAVKAAALGVIDTLRADEIGLWAEAQLDKRKQYVDAVLKLVERGALSWSSGSLPNLVKTAPDGRIERWVIVEGSLTPTPAEPRLTDVHALKSALDELNAAADTIHASRVAPLQTHAPVLAFPSSLSTFPYSQGDQHMDDFNVAATAAPRKRLPSAVEDATKAAWNRGRQPLRPAGRARSAAWLPAAEWRAERQGRQRAVRQCAGAQGPQGGDERDQVRRTEQHRAGRFRRGVGAESVERADLGQGAAG